MGSIAVFGKPYSVSYVGRVDEDDSFGEVDVRAGKIKILKTMSPAQRKETLLHEVLHIISEELCLGLSEKQVCSVAVGLFSFFGENSINIKLDGKK